MATAVSPIALNHQNIFFVSQVPQLPKNADNGHFSRLEYKSEPYADMEKFSKTQPLDKRKLGFG